MPRSTWVMLCPMARSGSSHTCEVLDGHDGVRCHHGLFNEGPFGRWPADQFIPAEKRDYYSSLLDSSCRRVGGQEHSGEFLDTYIFTDEPTYNAQGWECVGFKIQFVHLVHMPDLHEYLKTRTDVKIVLNTRRHLLEHACAEEWCSNGNSRAAHASEPYEFGKTEPVHVDKKSLQGTFRNLCRYRQYAIENFAGGGRDFLEWSYEDMFQADGSLDVAAHERLFDFLEISPTRPLTPPFARTPRPVATGYFGNYDELALFMKGAEGGVFEKFFDPEYDPRVDLEWPVLDNYRLGEIMVEKSNDRFRS